MAKSVLFQLDFGSLDQIAKALEFLTVQLRKLFGRDAARFTAQAFEFGLDVGHFQDFGQLVLQALHDVGQGACGHEHAEPGAHFEAAHTGLSQRIQEALIALADNATSIITHATLSKRIRCLRFSGNSTPENWNAAMAEQEQMMAALAARDGRALTRIMGVHIRNTWPRTRMW